MYFKLTFGFSGQGKCNALWVIMPIYACVKSIKRNVTEKVVETYGMCFLHPNI
jgi:hypothetical protein